MSRRVHSSVATALRRAIAEAGGTEVFAIGDVEDGVIVGIVVTCRGQRDRVTALLDRPRPGQVVIHNHPSGDLRPSNADMRLAARYGDDGVGVVIVDSDVTRSNWVVEPYVPQPSPVDHADVERFFTEQLPAVAPGFRLREAQLAMALRVADLMSDGGALVCEAGTGTGKSLAYLVPAALWAKANASRVVISTYTRALQHQLATSDLPLLGAAGLEVTSAVLLGRTNYVCKRRLGMALDDDTLTGPQRADLETIATWEATSEEGSRADLPQRIDPWVWEQVESDSDLTLRVRCPHYASCHYYTARRRAAAADLVVVNHALLLADLHVRDIGGSGILPKYTRLVLDEGHHLEDAATSAIATRVTARAIRRAGLPLLSRTRRKGALHRLAAAHAGAGSNLPVSRREQLMPKAAAAAAAVDDLVGQAPEAFLAIHDAVLDETGSPVRVPDPRLRGWTQAEGWAVSLGEILGTAIRCLDEVLDLFEDVTLEPGKAQPMFDVRRARRRLAGHLVAVVAVRDDDQDTCRWIEATRRSSPDRSAALCTSPIDLAPLLARMLWHPIPGSVVTSATLAVRKRFDFWLRTHGLRADDAATVTFPSPFDHANQAMLALPRDFPTPEQGAYERATAPAVVDAIRASGGGAFVLCTSWSAVEAYGRAIGAALPQQVVLVQGRAAPGRLLRRFREAGNAVLVGTDSFWEGVSVKGDALRLVVIPRLPFRVPTDPLRAARRERLERRGIDAFRAYTLPSTVLKLRQGYGRLLRSKDDRGVVLILDRRLHDRSYGALLRHSLPPARRVSAPWRRVLQAVRGFYEAG